MAQTQLNVSQDPLQSPAVSGEPQPGSGSCPLSFPQESLWFVEQMAPGTATYHLPEAWRFRGPLDLAALQSALDELAQSIRRTGIIQPLVVRRRGPRFQLLAGERRWRAAQLVSMHRVPVVVQDVPDEKAMEITLVENLQREDLNPIEQAQAFDRLIQEFHLTQEEAAERTGKERATVANALRLLRLDNSIREMVEDGRLTAGHARALLAIEDQPLRTETARRAARGNLTVRQIERLATHTRRHRTASDSVAVDANTRAAIDELQRVLGTRVTVNPCTKGHPGQVIVEFYNDGDLDRLYQLIIAR